MKAEVKKKINEYMSAYSKGRGTCCISNFNAKRVKDFRTLETDRELSYSSPALL